MPCSICNRDINSQPNYMCTSIGHWQVWSERLAITINEANDALFDVCHGDTEHQIECHADTLPQAFRSVSAGAEKAFETLQVIVREMVGE